ncbi:DVU0772 family protein [Desulfofalx alkaliphila]|uniref:DVU0772 family protein n=1 Tax=Desulfofalx alkaliphila TaxID=105483 RepID=UPI00068CE0AD|nr:hypothetical protein [Desulfofalx alkaliphila]
MYARDALPHIQWTFDLENEFKNKRQVGITFVIDLYKGTPRLVLYRIGPYSSYTVTLEKQPPKDLLLQAVRNQCTTACGDIDVSHDGLYNIDDEIKSWIEDNYLNNEQNDTP